VSRGGSGSMAGACLSTERRSTGARWAIGAPSQWAEIPEATSCDGFDRVVSPESRFGRVFAQDGEISWVHTLTMAVPSTAI
jgi:hypothetical protein